MDTALASRTREEAALRLRLGQVLEVMSRDAVFELGFSSLAAYALERCDRSARWAEAARCLARRLEEAKRWLAQRLEKLPCVAAALGSGQLGVEAAMQVVRVAAPATEAAWVAQARRRTLKHLREEVAAALVAVRWSGGVECPPPVEAEIAAFQRLEQAVVSGSACAAREGHDGHGKSTAASSRGPRVCGAEPTSEPRRAWFVMLTSLTAWLERGLQTSAGAVNADGSRIDSSAGRIMLRLRMSRANYDWWRGLEAQARPWLRRGVGWLRFLCLSLWQAWQHLFGKGVAYGGVYVRDRYRCTSPVCSRRDVTPHHIQFRSAGGSDEAHNITSGCTWCHLQGVHGGRIRVHGVASFLHWEIGAPTSPCLVVHGRERASG